MEVSISSTLGFACEALRYRYGVDLSVGLASGASRVVVGAGARVVGHSYRRDDVQRALSRLSPPRLSRCGVLLPNDAGIRLTPAVAVKATSFGTRPGCDHATRVLAAVTGPMPVVWSSSATGLAWTTSLMRHMF